MSTQYARADQHLQARIPTRPTATWTRRTLASVRLNGSRDQFRFRHNITDGSSFFVARYEHSMNCQVDTDPFGYLLVGQVFGGRLRLKANGHDELSPGRGELFLLDPHAPMRINWESFQAGLVKLDLDVVQRVAAETTGDPGAQVRFGLSRAVRPSGPGIGNTSSATSHRTSATTSSPTPAR